MSDFEPNDGNGFLFKNDRKTNEKAPDYKGSVKVNGVCFDLAGWINTSTRGTGKKFIGLKISDHWVKPELVSSSNTTSTPVETKVDPDMPF